MTPYALVYLIPAILAMAGNFLNREPLAWSIQPYAAFVYCTFLIFFIGLRYEVSGDWDQYKYLYNLAGELRLSDAMQRSDPGFMALCHFLSNAGFSFSLLLMLCAIVVVFGLSSFAFSTLSPWTVFCVASTHFTIVMSMGHVRQSVALGFIMLGIVALSRGSLLKYVFWCLIATSFHKSAALFLPMAGLLYEQRRAVMALFAALLSIVAYYVFVSDAVDLYNRRYLVRGYDSAGAVYRTLLNIAPAAIFCVYRRQFEPDQWMRRFWLLISGLALALFVLLLISPSTAAVDRLGKYCLPLQFYVYANLPRILGKNATFRLGVMGAVIAAHGIYLMTWLQYSELATKYWIPYRSIISP